MEVARVMSQSAQAIEQVFGVAKIKKHAWDNFVSLYK